jgi:MFS family permease
LKQVQGKKHQFFYGYIVAAACFVTWFIGWGSYGICFGLFFKPLLIEFHWTRAETSLAYSLSLLLQATMGITTGWLTDRMGPRIVVTILGSFVGWSFLLLSQVQTLWQFIIYFGIVGGMGASVLNTPIMATISRWFVKRRGLMTGLVQAGAGMGGFFLAPLTSWLILNYGWRHASFVIGLLTATLMILSGLCLIRDPRDARQFPDGQLADNPDKFSIPENISQPSGLSVNIFIKTAPFWMLIGIYGCFGYIRSTFSAHAAAYIQDLGYLLSDGAHVLAIIFAASILGRVGMGRIADIINNKRSLIIGYAIMAFIMIWLLFSKSLWELYIFGLFYGFGWGALAVLRFSVTAEVFGLASVGFIMGILGFSESIFAFFSSYLGGYIFDLSNSYQIAFILCLALSLFGLLLSWRLKPTETPVF